MTSGSFVDQLFQSSRPTKSDTDIQSNMPTLLIKGMGLCRAYDWFPQQYSNDLWPFTDAMRLLSSLSIWDLASPGGLLCE